MKKLSIACMVLIVLIFVTGTAFSQDSDGDSISDLTDNCIDDANGPVLGTCIAGENVIIGNCTNHFDCGTGGACPSPPCSSEFCSLNQDDGDNDDIGNVCDCNYEDINFPHCVKSFADTVISYTNTDEVGNYYDDPFSALGPPDGSSRGDYVSLGRAGELVVKFKDNAVTSNGDSDEDLWVFEIGSADEPTDVYVSTDGVTWVYVGDTEGGTSGVDLDAYIGSGIISGEEYPFVKLVDLLNGQSGHAEEGADIDAIGAIMSLTPLSTTTTIDSETTTTTTTDDTTTTTSTNNAGELGEPCYGNRTCNSNLICNENNICEEAEIGELNGPCYGNSTCNDGLICVDDICLDNNDDCDGCCINYMEPDSEHPGNLFPFMLTVEGCRFTLLETFFTRVIFDGPENFNAFFVIALDKNVFGFSRIPPDYPHGMYEVSVRTPFREVTGYSLSIGEKNGATTTTTTINNETTTTTTIDETTTTTTTGGEDFNITMISIPRGTFEMGCSLGDDECGSDESPRHTVTISAFQMSAYEITQGQWEAVMGNNPSHFVECGSNCPVERVSWNDVQDFLEELSTQTGKQYRLPTEAEWEYAARAGTTTPWYCGNKEGCLDDIAWYEDNSGETTHPVGQKQPNTWGLYDMTGNVSEWAYDYKDSDYYEYSPSTDPQGPDECRYTVLRGCGYDDDSWNCRSTCRNGSKRERLASSRGFRLCLSIDDRNSTSTTTTIYGNNDCRVECEVADCSIVWSLSCERGEFIEERYRSSFVGSWYEDHLYREYESSGNNYNFYESYLRKSVDSKCVYLVEIIKAGSSDLILGTCEAPIVY